MEEPEIHLDLKKLKRQPLDRLDSWKKIAVYLKRDVSTVQRWERREGMPVHRHLHDKQGSVFAYRSELDVWGENRRIESPAAVVDPEAAGPRARWFGPWRIAAALLSAAILIGFVIDSRFVWRNPLAEAKFSRLSDFTGTEQAAAISPDGKTVAFVASRGGQIDVWAGEIGGTSYRNLTHGALRELVNPYIRTLGFSADSSLVTIWSRKGDGTQPHDVSVYAAPTRGGSLRPYLPDAAEFDWSRDGRRLVYHTTAPGDPLFVRDGAAEARQIYAAAPGIHCHYPLWSTDGTYIYFVRGVPPNDWDIWRIRPSGAGLQRLTHHNARVGYPVMLDRRSMVYLVTDSDGSGPSIYGLDVERPIPHRLTSGLETYTSLTASSDGTRLVATTASPRTSLWHGRLKDDQTIADEPVFLVASAVTPRLGPGFLVFLSSRNGSEGVYTLTQAAVREIWRDARFQIKSAPTISPDGRRIALTVDDGTGTRILTMDKDGSHLITSTASLALTGDPAWSPDGRSIISATLHDGEPRLTLIPLNGGASAAILDEYSIDPVWSPNGGFFLYSGRDIGTTFPVRAATADGRPYAIPSIMLTRGARRAVILKSGSSMIVLRGDIGHKDLWAVDLQGRGERQLTTLPPDFNVGDFDISAEGTELVLDRVEENRDMALIERPRLSRMFVSDAPIVRSSRP